MNTNYFKKMDFNQEIDINAIDDLYKSLVILINYH